MIDKINNYLFAPYLDEGEVIYKVFHRHIFVILKDILGLIILGVLLPLFLYYLFPNYWLIFTIWILITWLRFVKLFLIWYHDAILLTNVSIIDVYWYGLFDRTSTRVEYNMIEGISYTIRGIIPTLFKYGDISIQIVSGSEAVSLKNAINPKKVERIIMEYQQKFTSEQNLKDADALKDLLTTMIRNHANKK